MLHFAYHLVVINASWSTIAARDGLFLIATGALADMVTVMVCVAALWAWADARCKGDQWLTWRLLVGGAMRRFNHLLTSTTQHSPSFSCVGPQAPHNAGTSLFRIHQTMVLQPKSVMYCLDLLFILVSLFKKKKHCMYLCKKTFTHYTKGTPLKASNNNIKLKI